MFKKQTVIVKFFEGYWTVDDIRNNKNSLFIYGDNDIHVGTKGQAVIRNEFNTAGIPTKKTPASYSFAYYNDDDYERNCANITKAIADIKKKIAIHKYEYLILPEDGLGTGLAKLPEKAPKTYEFLGKSINQLIRDVSVPIKLKKPHRAKKLNTNASVERNINGTT